MFENRKSGWVKSKDEDKEIKKKAEIEASIFKTEEEIKKKVINFYKSFYMRNEVEEETYSDEEGNKEPNKNSVNLKEQSF